MNTVRKNIGLVGMLMLVATSAHGEIDAHKLSTAKNAPWSVVSSKLVVQTATDTAKVTIVMSLLSFVADNNIKNVPLFSLIGAIAGAATSLAWQGAEYGLQKAFAKKEPSAAGPSSELPSSNVK